MNFDRDLLFDNTPDRREALVNIPESMKDFTLNSFAAKRPIPDGVMDWLSTMANSVERKSLVLYGDPGRGKTGLGVGLLRALARQGIGRMFRWNMMTSRILEEKIKTGAFVQTHLAPCQFERWPRLLSLQSRPKWDEASWFEKLEEDTTVLMIDDISVDTGTSFRESFLMRHLEWAEDKNDRVLILTVNEHWENWAKIYGARTADRLCEERRFTLVEVKGDSLR